MLYNICYIAFPKWLYNIQVWLYNIQDGYITHPNLPDGVTGAAICTWQLEYLQGTPSQSLGICYTVLTLVVSTTRAFAPFSAAEDRV